jgi:hypothetical protein
VSKGVFIGFYLYVVLLSGGENGGGSAWGQDFGYGEGGEKGRLVDGRHTSGQTRVHVARLCAHVAPICLLLVLVCILFLCVEFAG